MKIIIKQLLWDKLKEMDSDVEKYVKEGRRYSYDDAEINLPQCTETEIKHLQDLLRKSNLHGSRVIAADIDKYFKAAQEGLDTIRARTVRQAAWMMEKFIAELPNHHIFSRDDYGGDSFSAYWVEDVEYYPEKKEHGERLVPPKMVLTLFYIHNESRSSATITYWPNDCMNKTCLEMLEDNGYVPETPKLMERLKEETERFYKIRKKVGKQYVAKGLGFPDLDDAAKSSDSNVWWRRSRKIDMEKFGESKVVIDVQFEKDTDKDEHGDYRTQFNPYRWHKWNMRFFAPSEDEIVKRLEADEDTDEIPDFEIPVHPLVPCFDLKRHIRLSVHVNNLTQYKYNKEAAKNLILPERDWNMINLLVDHSSNEFQDVVSGKGRSMNILCDGKPGVGKTLTSEVFAEFKERPLYTVQCSQLGLEINTIEKNLSIILTRANRWNAVLLLDEADVYIHKRGSDVQQNAIVGVFLRVLEYASCILFMTTNRSESVDDAIASRCIARLHYEVPTQEDQARIWRALADINKLELSDKEIKKIVAAHPNLSGRDVKNLLKLASFYAEAKGQAIDNTIITFVSQFKPTME